MKTSWRQRQQKRRFCVLGVLLALSFVLLFTKAAQIQLLPNPRLERLAHRQYDRSSQIKMARAWILDREGQALVINLPSPSLAASPIKLQEVARLQAPKNPQAFIKTQAKELAKISNLSANRLEEKLQESKDFFWIKRHLNIKEHEKILKSKKLKSLFSPGTGLWWVKESKRFYPQQNLAQPLLGSVNTDALGLEGLELWQNKALQATQTIVKGRKDAKGRFSFFDFSQKFLATPEILEPESLKLTLDSALQFEVEKKLEFAMNETASESGGVLIMDAHSGEILVVAHSQKSARSTLFTDGYEPGSTLKALVLAASLSEGFKLTDEIWGEEGKFKIGGHTIQEAESKERFSWLSLGDMLQVSSNIVAAKVALGLGPETLRSWLTKFGLGRKTPLQFPAEISGQLPALKQDLELATLGFGQGLLVSPLQMLRAFAVFANGGFLVEPKLVLAKPGAPRSVQVERILTPQVAQGVKDALTRVTQLGGTGRSAVIPGLSIAGKTGTSQTLDPETKRYSKSKYIASFIGFVSNSKPTHVVLTILKHPKGRYYASQTAAPLFKEVVGLLAKRFSYPRQVEPKSQGLEIQAPLFLTQSEDRSIPAVSNLQMPNLKGLSMSEVLYELRLLSQIDPSWEKQIQAHGAGLVIGQNPAPGQSLARTQRINIKLAENFETTLKGPMKNSKHHVPLK